MPTLRERFTDLLLGDERRKLDAALQVFKEAYYQGPFVLPPDQLIAQLKEQDAALLTDLVHQLYWEHLGTPGYALGLTGERNRAIDESRRLWKYNPLAQWMIWLWTNYSFGENIAVTPEDEGAAEVWQEFWKADRNQAVLAQDRIADKLSNWLLVDGDRFLAFYASTLDGEATVRKINTKEIVEIVTDPDDASVPLFYKRQWTTPDGKQKTMYYPDWEVFFKDNAEDELEKAKLPANAERADQQNDKTAVCVLHMAYNGKDDDSLFGWPLLAAGSPWIRSQKRHLENRLAVSAAKAMYVRRAKVSGGSRQVDHVIANIQSALSSTQSYETSPSAVPGSTLVENKAVDTTDLPMTTGASDAKTDGEMFSWMAGLSGGVFPHYMGLGDAYRLATACYSNDTEALTENGWKNWWQVKKGEKIATYNHSARRIEYMMPTKLHVYEYDGAMVAIKGRGVDALVTPNHRMLALNENNVSRKWAKKEFEVIEADKLPSRFALPTKAKIGEREGTPTFTLPIANGGRLPERVILMDDWLEFLGWWLTEGWITKSDNQYNYSVGICQHVDSPNVSKIRSLITRLPFGFNESTCNDGRSLRWRVNDKSLYMWLKENCGKGSDKKRLPDFALSLNIRQSTILLDTLWDGDGHWEDSDHYQGCFTSTSRQLIDDVQILMLHNGYWGGISLNRAENSHPLFENTPACYLVYRTRQAKRSLARRRNVSSAFYEGTVWCFEAPPNKMFITRRNGKPLIAGNTSMEKPLEMQFSRYQVFWSAQFRKKVRIVLQFREKYGGAKFQSYEAEVSTDRLVEVDLDGMSQALGRVFQMIVDPMAERGAIPDDVLKGMLQATLRTVLQALGVDAEEVAGDEKWEVEREGELEESTALAVQNYRDGLIDADDLVAFLVPTRLEEHDRSS